MEFEFKVGKHNLTADVSFHIEHDGIGWYEYGSITAYDDEEVPELDSVDECYLVRTGRCEKPEDVPACADRVDKIYDKDKNVIGYEWVHEREINADASDAVYEAIDEYMGDHYTTIVDDYKAERRAEDSMGFYY